MISVEVIANLRGKVTMAGGSENWKLGFEAECFEVKKLSLAARTSDLRGFAKTGVGGGGLWMDGGGAEMIGSRMNPPAARRKSWIIKGIITLGCLLLVLLGLWLWSNRPIRPVELSVQEKAVVTEKVEAIQKPTEAVYEKGGKEIILTERELNGLLNENTTLGNSVCFELATNAIHARVETDLDPDLPVVGGKRLKARARFLVGDAQGKATLILEDLTVWGISLPNEWLGGLKGHDLLGEAIGAKEGKIPGVEEFKVEPGKLTIRLKK